MSRAIATHPDLFCAYYEASASSEGIGRKAVRNGRAIATAVLSRAAVLRNSLIATQR